MLHMRATCADRWIPGREDDLNAKSEPSKWRWLAICDFAVGVLLFGPAYGVHIVVATQMATAAGFIILHLSHVVEGYAERSP